MSQALEALKYANAIRIEYATTRRELASLPHVEGLERVAAILSDPPPSIQRMRVGLLLRAVHRLGDTKTRRLLRSADIFDADLQIGPEYRDLQKRRVLTERQRLALAAECRKRAA